MSNFFEFRIFSPHESECSGEEAYDKHPNRNSRGQLRTKIESGEGTIPVKSSAAIQTWDGILQVYIFVVILEVKTSFQINKLLLLFSQLWHELILSLNCSV